MSRARAAEAGLDLTFLRTIPGSIGGAVRMNAQAAMAPMSRSSGLGPGGGARWRCP